MNDANGATVSYECRHLVLATGASDKAGCLGVPGESFPFVTHDLKGLEDQISNSEFSTSDDENHSKLTKKHRDLKISASFDNIQNVSLDESLWHPPSSSKVRVLPRKDKILMKTKSNSSLLCSETSNKLSVGNILKSTDNIPKQLSESGMIEADSKRLKDDKVQNINEVYFNSVLRENNHELMQNINTYIHSNEFSDGKTVKNSDNVWLTNNTPTESLPVKKERHLSLNELRTDEGETGKYFFCNRRCSHPEKGEEVEKLPILVVGAGLSAADATLTARRKNYPVIHAFRRSSPPTPLPAVMYPEYHEVRILVFFKKF